MKASKLKLVSLLICFPFIIEAQTISNVTITDSILCNGDLGGIIINILQSTPATNPLEIVVGSFPFSWGPTYFVKTTSASVLTITSIVIPSLPPGDYTIRLVDPVAYYAANPNGNGTSLAGIYDTWATIISFTEPDSLTATTTSTVGNMCFGDCIAEERLEIDGGTTPYSFAFNGGPMQTLIGNDSVQYFIALCENMYDVIVTDANGCPSLNVSFPPNLTSFIVNEPSDIIFTDTQSACDNYTWNGVTYSASGLYTYSTVNSDGCDSVTILDLIINSTSVTNNVFDTACGEYNWDGTVYNTSGVYANTFTAIDGCDSLVYLQLTVFEDSSVTYITACDSAQWNGVWYYNDTTVTDTGFVTSTSFGGVSSTNSGNEGNIWYFGENAGLDFNSGVPVALTDGQLNTMEGCASIADNNGDLLFYTDGMVVYNKNHTLMPNGTGLLGNNSSTQSSIIVKKPASSTIYYIFTADGITGSSGGLNYSEVDITLDGGLGDVTANKNILLIPFTCEKVTAIKHQNSSDFWIISPENNTNIIHSFLLTSAGINMTPILTTAQSPVSGVGYLKGSPDGSRIVLVNAWPLNFELYNFNNATGELTFQLQKFMASDPYGAEFSPNSNLLYISVWPGAGVWQFDLLAGSNTSIINSALYLGTAGGSGGALQLAPDNKIYQAVGGGWGAGVTILPVINNPDIVGIGSDFNVNGVDLGGKASMYGLPTFYSSIFNSPPSGCDSVATAIIAINNSTSNTTTDVDCGTYTWAAPLGDGNTYTASGIYSHVSTNAAGCTHTETLNLTIDNSTSNSTTQTSCDTYTWLVNNQTYTTSGTYSDVSTNAAGCTHTETLNLTIDNSTSTHADITICDIYFWPVTGQYYTTTDIYISTSVNSLNCTHIDTLGLTILNSSVHIDDVGIHCDNYTWIDGITYTTTNNTATFIYTNSLGCDSIIALELVISSLDISGIVTPELCDGYYDGSIDLTVTGSLGSLAYNWSGVNSFYSVDEDIYNLNPGNYDVVVTDNISQCTQVANYSINNGFYIQVNVNVIDVSCYDSLDGSIEITPINLTNPIYIWSDIPTSLEDRYNLTPGIYGLEISNNNCNKLYSFTIYQPDSLYLTAQQSSFICEGNFDGEIAIQVYGGTPNYLYFWSNWSNTATNSNLGPDLYSLTVLDDNDCILKDSFEILDYTIETIIINNDVLCFDDSTGSIDIEVSGGFQPYSYSWSNGSTTQDLYYLSSNQYSCTIIDYLGCTIDTFVYVNQPQILSALPIITNVSCYGENNGAVNLIISGGIAPYNIDWGSIDTNNLFEGTYHFEITDSNACILYDSVYIDEPDSFYVNVVTTDVQCYGEASGAIEIIIQSNSLSLPYTYSWSGPNLFSSTDEDLVSLYAGVYFLTIIDANLCEKELQISLNEPSGLSQYISIQASNYSGYHIACRGDNSGWISVNINGGYVPYSFLWYNGQTADSLSSLYAGIHSLIIQDGLGCTIEYEINLIEPSDNISGDIQSINNYNGFDISCYKGTDGGILEIPFGGVPPYYYELSTGQNTNPINFLGSGYYTLFLYDNNGCLWIDTITLYEPDSFYVNINSITDTCSRGVGKIEVSAYGGVSPYEYLWNINTSSPIVDNLASGDYNILISDLNECLIDKIIIVANLPKPDINFLVYSDYDNLYAQWENPIVFIDITDSDWQQILTWDWDYGDYTYGVDSISSHSYIETGTYTVVLTLTTSHNCIDTLSKKVIIDAYDLFIPNSFTPGKDDNINSVFLPYGIGVEDFEMNIFSRWGELLYSTSDINLGWNGKYFNSDKECQIGVYVYYIELKDIFGAIHKYEGKINLIR